MSASITPISLASRYGLVNDSVSATSVRTGAVVKGLDPRSDFPPEPAEQELGPETTVIFERFFREQYQALLLFLRRRSQSAEDAEDAAQESLSRFMRYVQTEPQEAWKPILYRIAINVVSDRGRRSLTHEATKHVSFNDLELESDQPNAEDEASRAQELLLIRDAILALPPKCQQVYLLKRFKGMSNAAVAKHCGISVKMVEKHAANAITHIRQRLGRALSSAY
jgi:RNA polymerase sigma-70 factor (ECF subfamily)